jgi:hypothetical protein
MATDSRHASLRSEEINRRLVMPFLGAGAAFAMLAGKAQAQQVPTACHRRHWSKLYWMMRTLGRDDHSRPDFIEVWSLPHC